MLLLFFSLSIVFGGAFPGQGGGGCWAEKVVVAPGPYRLYKLPKYLNFRQSCNILSNYSTAWAGLVIIGGIKKGQVVLTHAGAGGVSLAAIHIAKHLFNCTVIATCGSETKRQVCLEQGADYAIDYTVTKDWASEVKRICEKDLGRKGQRIGVDLVYDPIAAVNDSLKACAWGGKIVVIGFASRDAATDPERVPTNRILIKQCSVLGCRAGESGLGFPTSSRSNISCFFHTFPPPSNVRRSHGSLGYGFTMVGHLLPLRHHLGPPRNLPTALSTTFTRPLFNPSRSRDARFPPIVRKGGG